jgi:Putative peptidoglycan binding domain
MKKLTSLLIGCSLALAGAALAQQPVEQQSPSKGKRAPEKTYAPQAQPKAKPETPAAKQQAAMKERGVTNERGATNEPGAGKRRKTPATEESATTAGQQNRQANTGARAKKPEPQQVQQIKSQHANFRAQPKPQQVPAVTFNQNYRIQGSEQWQGPQYEVFRSYRPERHDQGWYQSHYNRVELIGGGYYYWNNGYWFPAWGYSPSAEYYAYDGPIYVGQRAEPPDQVIADVQAVLQQMGYYRGEVDGLLGPLTREALAAYQADNGLTTTAAIDEPTLDSLGMG